MKPDNFGRTRPPNNFLLPLDNFEGWKLRSSHPLPPLDNFSYPSDICPGVTTFRGRYHLSWFGRQLLKKCNPNPPFSPVPVFFTKKNRKVAPPHPFPSGIVPTPSRTWWTHSQCPRERGERHPQPSGQASPSLRRAPTLAHWFRPGLRWTGRKRLYFSTKKNTVFFEPKNVSFTEVLLDPERGNF